MFIYWYPLYIGCLKSYVRPHILQTTCFRGWEKVPWNEVGMLFCNFLLFSPLSHKREHQLVLYIRMFLTLNKFPIYYLFGFGTSYSSVVSSVDVPGSHIVASFSEHSP